MDNWTDEQGVEHEGTIPRLKRLGIPTIMDLDDYWAPGTHHPAYLLIKQSGIAEKIIKNIKLADYICTTTDIFADELKKYNPNVFVLPNAIDPRERQYTPKPEKSDRLRIGWLGGSCLTPDTEILTNKGWKYFEELEGDEKVATLNSENNNIEYHKPEGHIKEKHDGDIYVCDTNEVSFSVTPNHNMYASESKSLTHKKLNYGLNMMENLDGKNFHVKKDGININKDISDFILPGVKPSPYDRNDYSEKIIKMDDWLKVFGFWIADGWTCKSTKDVGFCQFKDNDYLIEIKNILNSYNINANISGCGNRLRSINKQLHSYLSQFGKANNKFIPRDLLNNLSERQLNILLDWYLKGDGSEEKCGDYVRRRGYTVSKQLADDLMEIAFKVGEGASIKNRGMRTPKPSLNENGKERKIKPNYDAYQIGFYRKTSKHNKLNPLVRKEKIRKEKYNGYVYCVNVKNNIIYVRRNGKAFWVGNSHLKDLELLSGVVNKLKTEGLMDKVQFVLCGFDTRGFITHIDERTGERKQEKIKPIQSVWYKYEQIFTDNHSIVSPEYKEHLLEFTKEEYHDVANEPYRRVWTKPISTYATNYNLFDISLAPIDEHIFNNCKSQLKVIEAGFHKKAIIAQDYGPYQIDIVNALEKGGIINENGNGLLVSSNKNHKQWYQHIKRLINNPELVNQLSTNLFDTVKDTYSIQAITETRRDWYKSLVKKD